MQAFIPYNSTVYRLMQDMERMFDVRGRYVLPLGQRLMVDLYENLLLAVEWTE